MARKILFILLILNIFSGFVSAQSKDGYCASITTWYHDKAAAVSITFDDACYTQYQYALPVLQKYGIKATFSLVGEWTKEKPTYSAEPGFFEIKKMGWEEIRKLSDAGNEIAAHGFKHRKYGKYKPSKELAAEMRKIKTLIEDKLHIPVYTLHYPYSFTSDSIVKAAAMAGFLFGRTHRETFNDPDTINPYLLASRAILNDSTPSLNDIKDWLFNIKARWLILMYHHLFPEGSLEMNILKNHKVKNTYSLLPATFEKQIKLLSESGYWIAPLSVAGKYILERQNTNIKVRKFFNTLKIKTKTTLDPRVFDQPLTLKVVVPWKKVKVEGSLKDGIYTTSGNELLIDFMPGATVKISKKK